MAGVSTAAKAWTARTYDDVARFCGVSVDSVKRWAGQGMPSRKSPYRLDKIVQWLRHEGPWRPKVVSEIDPLMAGGDGSPGLERYRLARAAQEEIKLQGLREETIDREQMHTILQRASTIIRQSVETLQQQFGSEAAKIINDGLCEAERVLYAIGGDDNSSES